MTPCEFTPYQLHLKRCNVVLDKPCIMGILNVTPDSFSAVGRFQDVEQAVAYGIDMVENGASVIDVGGEPTNPGKNPVLSLKEELQRVIPVVEKLRQCVDVPISIDTSKPEVMEAGLAAGADIINDVRALRLPGALEVVAKQGAAVCLMHMSHPNGVAPGVSPYDSSVDMLQTVKTFLQERVAMCLAAGIAKNNIILDPGIGAGSFGKTTVQSLQLMNSFEVLHELGFPILIGTSRKTFIGEVLDLPVEKRLNASVATAVMAAMKGAALIRVHDVQATAEAIAIIDAILKAGKENGI